MTKAVGYARVSSIGQVDGHGLSRQEEAIEACCVDKRFEFLRHYREEGVAGKLGEDDRPAFQRMVADLLGNGCRTVVVESLDRLARQYDIQQQLATYLASKGLTLVAANTGEDITAALMGDPMRRALVQIQGIFAELDKNLLIAKLRKAREKKKAETGRGCGKMPYGGLAGEADVLSVMRRLRADGLPYHWIADALNQAGTLARNGGQWSAQTVHKILNH